MNPSNSHLEPFGSAVLAILESAPEWDADVFERIQAAADESGLATVDRNGNFKIKGRHKGTTNLAKFAADVLGYLHRTKEWNPEDLDLFAEVAASGGLGKIRKSDGRFVTTAKGVRSVPSSRRNPMTDMQRAGSNPYRPKQFRKGELVMGIQGVDGGYAGRVVSTSVDRRGNKLVVWVGDDGKERETYDFNLTRNVPEKGKWPRHNPSKRIDVRITFANGHQQVTGFNGTLDDARSYYLGRSFELDERKPMVKVVKVELVRDTHNNPLTSGARIPAASVVNRGAASMT